MDTLAFQGYTIIMLWLGVPLWQSILGFHGYSGIPGIYYSNAMARGTLWQSILGLHGYSGIPGIYHSNVTVRVTPLSKYSRILWMLSDTLSSQLLQLHNTDRFNILIRIFK